MSHPFPSKSMTDPIVHVTSTASLLQQILAEMRQQSITLSNIHNFMLHEANLAGIRRKEQKK
jgi:hypothetical protein